MKPGVSSAGADGVTSQSAADGRTRRRWATRRRWLWVAAAAHAHCLRRPRRDCPTATSRARDTPTPTRTTGASGAAARAPSGMCARRPTPPSPRTRTRTPFDAAARDELTPVLVCHVTDDSRSPNRRLSIGPPPSSVRILVFYKVLENLIFNSLKFYSLIYITVKVIEYKTVPGKLVCARIFT